MKENSRRELKVRQQGWVRTVTKKLVATHITPNQISLSSLGFSALAAGCFYLFSITLDWYWLILAPIFVQIRLLCNLFDGLVAVEGGKGTPSGELFNDIPDRFADIMILIAVGYATLLPSGIYWGWIAGVLAILTAYVRTLSACLGAPMSFVGPMAKQHRMAVVTVSSLLAIVEDMLLNSHYVLYIALVVIALGSLFTCYRRARQAYHFLENNPTGE
ncbi:MAG: CDP-diacylglycerol--glycerol-3-phosphate 3-phosphatidyltransferase [Gammaproteobacteria bacterium]|nr:MAG: CDP-diacylglycerol--glycerol-3-phosphate 3-phosphatidyltransferase [Gammaproteobacteria bacterium]